MLSLLGFLIVLILWNCCCYFDFKKVLIIMLMIMYSRPSAPPTYVTHEPKVVCKFRLHRAFLIKSYIRTVYFNWIANFGWLSTSVVFTDDIHNRHSFSNNHGDINVINFISNIIINS